MRLGHRVEGITKEISPAFKLAYVLILKAYKSR
jgi:hypothetical protein